MALWRLLLLSVLCAVTFLAFNAGWTEAKRKSKKGKRKSPSRATRSDAGLAVTAKNALEHFNEAQESMSSGQISKSIQHYHAALELFPIFPMATWNLGLLYQQAHMYDDLETLYRNAISQEDGIAGSSRSRQTHPSLADQLSAEPLVQTAHQLSSGSVHVEKVPFRAGVRFYLGNLLTRMLEALPPNDRAESLQVSRKDLLHDQRLVTMLMGCVVVSILYVAGNHRLV